MSSQDLLTLPLLRSMIRKYALEDAPTGSIVIRSTFGQPDSALPPSNYGRPACPELQDRKITRNHSSSSVQNPDKDYWMRITFGKDHPTPLKKVNSSVHVRPTTPKKAQLLTPKKAAPKKTMERVTSSLTKLQTPTLTPSTHRERPGKPPSS
jgi:hypothetical protein